MEILLVVGISLLSYFVVLSRKNIRAFKEEKMRISFLTASVITLYIFKVNLKIAWEKRSSFRIILYICRQFFFRYDIPLAILVGVVQTNMELSQVKVDKGDEKKSGLINWFKSGHMKNNYSEILEAECYA